MGRDHLVVFTIARIPALMASGRRDQVSITRDKSGSVGIAFGTVSGSKLEGFPAFSSILFRKSLELQGSVAPACSRREAGVRFPPPPVFVRRNVANEDCHGVAPKGRSRAFLVLRRPRRTTPWQAIVDQDNHLLRRSPQGTQPDLSRRSAQGTKPHIPLKALDVHDPAMDNPNAPGTVPALLASPRSS